MPPKLISCQCLALATCISGTFRRAPHERRRDQPVQKSSECRYREGIQPYRPNPLLQQRTRRVVKQGYEGPWAQPVLALRQIVSERAQPLLCFVVLHAPWPSQGFVKLLRAQGEQ